MSLQEFLVASLTPEGTNYDPESWMFEPDLSFPSKSL